MFRIFKITVSLFLLSFCNINAQEYFTSVQKYNIKDGLSDNFASEIYQDSKGYIWIPTPSGLNRFDGHEFKLFTKEKNDFCSNDLLQVFEDRNRKLWTVSRGKWNTDGLTFYTRKIDIFDPLVEKAISLDTFLSLPFEQTDMRWFFEDHQKNIWISTRQGAIYKYDGNNLTLIFQKKVRNNWLGRFAIASDGKIGFLEKEKVTVLDSLGRHLYSADLPYECVLIYAGLNGAIWVANTRSYSEDNGELRFWFVKGEQQLIPFYLKNKDGNRFKFNKESNIYTSLRMDKKGRYWGFVGEQLLLFNAEGILTHDFTDILKTYDIPAESILFNFGSEDFLWLASEKGAFSIALREKQFQEIIKSKEYAIDGYIIDDGQGNVLISQEDIIKLNTQNKIVDKIPIKNAIIAQKDKKGNIWWGDKNLSFYLYDPIKNSVITIFDQTSSRTFLNETLFIRRPILSMFVNEDAQQIFIGLREGGITVLDINTGQIQPFDQYGDFPQLKKLIVNRFFKNNGGVWLCTNDGLFLLDEKKGIIEQFKKSENGITFNNIYFIHEDGDSIFWMATKENGLIHWNVKTGEAKKFTKEDGLSHNTVYAIYEDQYGQLWMPSGISLMQMDKTTKEIFTWTSDDGLPFNEFIYNYHFQSPDGQLFIGGAEGDVIAFHPFKTERPTVPLTVTEYLEYDNQAAVFIDRSHKLQQQEKIIVPPDVNAILFKMALFDYTAPANIEYSFYLNGSAKEHPGAPEWTLLEDNIIRLNNLPYGHHEIQIKAIGTDNHRTQGFLSVPIFVEKPFYLKAWFLVLMGMAFLALVYFYNKWRTYQLLQDKKRLEQEVAARTQTILEQKKELEILNSTKDRFFAIIAHDMRNAVYNFRGVTDKINYFIQRKQPERIQEFGNQINTAVGNLTNLMNNLLEWALQQKNAFPFEPVNIDFNKKINHVLKNLQEQADQKQIDIEIHIEENIFVYADNNALSTILRNVVGNAIKFTPLKGKISVMAENKGKETSIRIIDTGKGMNNQQVVNLFQLNNQNTSRGTAGEKGSGLGLVLVKELMDINRGKIKVKSEKGKGTIIQLILPSGESPSLILNN